MLPIAVGVNVLQQAIEIYVNTGHKALMPGVASMRCSMRCPALRNESSQAGLESFVGVSKTH